MSIKTSLGSRGKDSYSLLKASKSSITLLHQEAFIDSSNQTKTKTKDRKMLYRGSRLPADRMSGSASVPVEVGTRGTIGSLLKKEIEYFRKVEMEFSCGGTSAKSSQSSVSGNSYSSWPGFGFLMLKWKKKKRRVSGGGGLQSVCSLVDVSDTHRMNEFRGFSYVNLKVDSKRFQEQTVLS